MNEQEISTVSNEASYRKARVYSSSSYLTSKDSNIENLILHYDKACKHVINEYQVCRELGMVDLTKPTRIIISIEAYPSDLKASEIPIEVRNEVGLKYGMETF